MTRLAVVLATAGGAGYFPVAPGTVGSAVGVVVFLLTQHWTLVAQATLLAAIALAGSWAGTVAATHFGRKDPGHVVIDEVAGQLLTLLATGPTALGILLAFLIFRALDIVKPWPARSFERFPGGWGIMADDLMAGVYGNIALRLAQAAGFGMF
jgi:phosphatidylglycerophosphatase A